jgi:hypothetical protein
MKKLIGSKFLLFVLLTVLVISGCAPAQTPVQFTLTPLPTDTLVPTNTSVPTNTPAPTRTPVPPTATIQAPDKTLEYLNGVKVVHIDNFDKDSSKWGVGLASGGIRNGVLEVIGKDWNGVRRYTSFRDNQGIIIDFTYTHGSVFEMYVDNGSWDTDSYKRFGIYVEGNSARVNVWAGKNGLGGARLSGNFSPKPDTTYSLLMAILPNGEFLGVIWDLSDSTKTIYYREKIGKNWSDLTWEFAVGADKGTIIFDNYREITFDSV